jgi:Flp pilus assembly protein TadG
MRWRRLRSSAGQGVVEMALMMPFLLVVALGVVEFSYALLDEHVVTKLAREGSNLISRDTTLEDATTAIRSMATRPVDFDNSATVIFTVLRKVATTGAGNYDQVIVYQRHQYGSLSVQSALQTVGAGSFGGAPDYTAANSDNDTNLQVTTLPANLSIARGGFLYVTEIYTKHTLITPLDRLGISVPQTLYSIAYF